MLLRDIDSRKARGHGSHAAEEDQEGLKNNGNGDHLEDTVFGIRNTRVSYELVRG